MRNCRLTWGAAFSGCREGDGLAATARRVRAGIVRASAHQASSFPVVSGLAAEPFLD